MWSDCTNDKTASIEPNINTGFFNYQRLVENLLDFIKNIFVLTQIVSLFKISNLPWSKLVFKWQCFLKTKLKNEYSNEIFQLKHYDSWKSPAISQYKLSFLHEFPHPIELSPAILDQRSFIIVQQTPIIICSQKSGFIIQSHDLGFLEYVWIVDFLFLCLSVRSLANIPLLLRVLPFFKIISTPLLLSSLLTVWKSFYEAQSQHLAKASLFIFSFYY